mgnify:FL=1
MKEIRRQIAEANDIEYVTEECQYKGDCLGTCPKCEAEVRYLEEQLHQRQLLGKAAMVAGISVGMFTLSSSNTKGTQQGDVPRVQKVDSLKDENIEKIESVVGQIIPRMPSFPGGYPALAEFLSKNTTYPEQAEKEGIQGRVICKFDIDEKGYISNIKVVKPIHPLLDAEAVRVISVMPRWIPAKQLGVAVKTRFALPITFRLNNDTDSTKTNNK